MLPLLTLGVALLATVTAENCHTGFFVPVGIIIPIDWGPVYELETDFEGECNYNNYIHCDSAAQTAFDDWEDEFDLTDIVPGGEDSFGQVMCQAAFNGNPGNWAGINVGNVGIYSRMTGAGCDDRWSYVVDSLATNLCCTLIGGNYYDCAEPPPNEEQEQIAAVKEVKKGRKSGKITPKDRLEAARKAEAKNGRRGGKITPKDRLMAAKKAEAKVAKTGRREGKITPKDRLMAAKKAEAKVAKTGRRGGKITPKDRLMAAKKAEAKVARNGRRGGKITPKDRLMAAKKVAKTGRREGKMTPKDRLEATRRAQEKSQGRRNGRRPGVGKMTQKSRLIEAVLQ